jgi:hypothetical protein
VGSPIRTPWDHSSVDSSPRPIAASHVLHRLLVPRHPPSALKNLTKTITTKLQKPHPTTTQPAHKEPPDHREAQISMLASTIHISTNNQPQPPETHQTRKTRRYEKQDRDRNRKNKRRLFLQDPTGCPNAHPSRTRPTIPHTPPQQRAVLDEPSRCRNDSTSVSAIEPPATTLG